MVLPFVEVSHLASSSSFYAAVLQPLGLHYLCSGHEARFLTLSSAALSLGSVTYGAPQPGSRYVDLETPVRGIPVLQIREPSHPFQPLKLSSLVLAAPSRAAVSEFHACALRANSSLVGSWVVVQGGVSRTTIHDLDGNTMEVVYPYPVQYTSASIRETQSTGNEVGRILNWNYGVAAQSPDSLTSHSMSHRTSSRPGGEVARIPLRRSATTSAYDPSRSSSTVVEDPPAQPSNNPRQSSKSTGFNTSTVVSALLGVAAGAAAGAAITYNFVTREKDRKLRQGTEHPFLPRRSTFPENVPLDPKNPYEDTKPVYGDYPPRKLDNYPSWKLEDHPPRKLDEYAPRRITYPSPKDNAHMKLFSAQDNPSKRPNYHGDDDDLSDDDKDGLYEQTPRPTHYLTNYETSARSVARSATRSTTSRTSARDRAVADDSYDTRSRYSSRHTARPHDVRSRSEAPGSRPPTVRAYSEVPSSRGPSLLRRHSSRTRSEAQGGRAPSEPPVDRDPYADRDRRSHTGSRYSAAHRSGRSGSRSHRPHRDGDRDSYISTRSHRTSGTARQLPIEQGDYEVVGRGGPKGRSSRHPSYSSPRGELPLMSMADMDPGYASGPDAPVPRSGVGGAPTYYSSRDFPLPMSNVGSNHPEWDDDLVSLAPSDSISCVGSKQASRRHRRR